MSSATHLTKLIRIQIPKEYQHEPIICHLISQFNLTVNITSAVLGNNAVGDGWFALQIKGEQTQIHQAIDYLKGLNVEIWSS